MKKPARVVFLILGVLILAAGIFFFLKAREKAIPTVQNAEVPKPVVSSSNMKLLSSAFENQGKIPVKYTCDGEDISPPLSISNVPADTKSLVLIVDDPDAPLGNWVHWLLWNINPGTLEIKEAEAPAGSVQGLNSFDKNGYGGPCPPLGTHHYQFKLYAIDKILSIDKNSKKNVLEAEMQGHILDQTILVGLYSKN